MRLYHKISIGLKILKEILIVFLAIYCIYLATISIFCMNNNLIFDYTKQNLLYFSNFKSFIFDIYIVTFIMCLFLIFYLSRKQKYTKKQILSSVVNSLFVLPISSLLFFNFVVLGSFMRNFYMLVVFVVVNLIINQLTNRIDKLYNIAVGNIETNRKGDKKVCKEK